MDLINRKKLNPYFSKKYHKKSSIAKDKQYSHDLRISAKKAKKQNLNITDPTAILKLNLDYMGAKHQSSVVT